jgi:hypothetical protein
MQTLNPNKIAIVDPNLDLRQVCVRVYSTGTCIIRVRIDHFHFHLHFQNKTSHDNTTSSTRSFLVPPLIRLQKIQLLIINRAPPMLPYQHNRFHRIHSRKLNQANSNQNRRPPQPRHTVHCDSRFIGIDEKALVDDIKPSVEDFIRRRVSVWKWHFVQLDSGFDEVCFGVGWFTDADNVGDIVFFAFLDVEVEIVGTGCVHD